MLFSTDSPCNLLPAGVEVLLGAHPIIPLTLPPRLVLPKIPTLIQLSAF